MKTTLFSLLIALVCDSLLAEEIDVNGRFRSPTPGGLLRDDRISAAA